MKPLKNKTSFYGVYAANPEGYRQFYDGYKQVRGNLRTTQTKQTDTMDFKIKHILVVLTLTVFTSSCNKTSPAGFWTEFHKDLITAKNSDQGPWGGHREISWKSETDNFFTSKSIVDFADKNEWKLIDSISFSADTLTRNSNIKLKNDDYSIDIFKDKVLPKLTTKDSKLFVFKTTWLAVEPGNTRETFENGFAVLNADKTELKIYHLWGE